ncbi:MAG: TIGR01212 family radical SAM protein [Lachnospiraceae bacterium]|nr:TIGR01212 family radical SAM protein [Lachnospiraceae bacterium]
MKQKMLSEALRERFGTKVYKLSLSSGCTCPNRDGTIGIGGCTFCSEGGSGEFAAPFLPVDEQIRLARARVDGKFPAKIPVSERKYIAYFQSFTNTYGEPERLRALYEETIRRPEIAALSIGTRPDCLSADILQMLGELSRIKPVWVELGLQTIHERTAEAVHRGYSLPAFEDAVKKLKAIGAEVIVHVILGLPGESREDMLETVRFLSGMDPRPDGIKLQQLQILRGTQLAEQYRRTPFPVMDLEEYCALIRDCLEILPDDIVIHRLTGDGPKKLLIAPQWSADKKRVLNTMRKWTAHKPPGGL